MLILLSSHLSYIVYKSAHSVMRGVKARAAQLVMWMCFLPLSGILFTHFGTFFVKMSFFMPQLINQRDANSCQPYIFAAGAPGNNFFIKSILKHNLDFIVDKPSTMKESLRLLGQPFHIQLMPAPSVKTGKWRWCKQDRGSRHQRGQSQRQTVAASSRTKGVTRLRCLMATTEAYFYLCCYNNGCCGTNSLIKNMLDTQGLPLWSWQLPHRFSFNCFSGAATPVWQVWQLGFLNVSETSDTSDKWHNPVALLHEERVIV